MATYTNLENHETFYVTLCFFIVVIVLAGLLYCTIMTEIIVYDTWKVDQHTLNLDKLPQAKNNTISNYRRHNLKKSNPRKWNQLSKTFKKNQKQIKLTQKIQKRFRIQTGIAMEQLINFLFENMLMELKVRRDIRNKLCSPLVGDSTDDTSAIETVPEEPDLLLKQNILIMLIKTFLSFTPEMLGRLVSPDIFPSISIRDILKKLKDQIEAEQNFAWVTTNEHDTVNKKTMRKIGETKGVVLESLIKEIEVSEETTEIVDPQESKTELSGVSVDEINCTSSTINTKLTNVEHLTVEQSDIKSVEVSKIEPFDVEHIDATKLTSTESSAVKPSDVVKLNNVEETNLKPFDVKLSHADVAPIHLESIEVKVKPSAAEPIKVTFSDVLNHETPKHHMEVQ